MSVSVLEEALSTVADPNPRGKAKLIVFTPEEWEKVNSRIIETGNKYGVYEALNTTMTERDGEQVPIYPKSYSSFCKELNEFLMANT